MKRLFLALTTLALLLPDAIWAQQQGRYVKFLSGTGFFINRQGKLITNAHVVDGCRSIVVSVPKGDLPATIAARDAKTDLAVLQVSGKEVPAIASLRWNIDDLRLGDDVAILGYPGKEGAMGQSSFVKTKVIGMVGPRGEANWLQLASVVRKGNSGGPVLDSRGNVIAVVTGYLLLEQDDAGRKEVGRVDYAITLEALQDFLQKSQVSFYKAASGELGYGDKILEHNASQFIVPIRCYQ